MDYLSTANRDILVTEDGSFTQRYVYDENSTRISAEYGYAVGTKRGEGGENLQSDFAANDVRKVWYRTSHLGSTLFAVDENGKVISHTIYDPWGNPLTETYTDTNFSGIDNANNYTGYTWDEVLDLYFAQNRFYDPADHRFTQEDPIKDGENWYAYCGNNPAITVDTYGLAATNVRYVYGDDVNFRKGPGKRFQSIAMLKRNTRVYYQNEKSWADSYNWAKVKYSKYTGWIADTYLSTGPHYFTTLSCRLIYQSARSKGVTADNKTAPDMTYNDYTFNQIAALHPYFEYQLKESADTLFHEFSSMATDFFATGKMNDVILDMIQHFRYGNGKPYSNSVLTQEVKNHSSTQNFINGVKDIIKNQLAFNGGNLGALDYATLKNKIGNLTRPSFSTWYDRIHGLTITINDTWGNNVQVINYKVSGTKFSGTLRFNIYDHFGLDQPDVEKIYGDLAGFRAWFTLQHYQGFKGQYKPFVTEIYFDIPFEGNIVR